MKSFNKFCLFALTLLICSNCLFGNNNPPSCVTCCCGDPTEVGIPNGDFEAPPVATPNGFIDFATGSSYANWDVSSGTVSIHGPLHNNLGQGNPNGASQHMDLNGSTNGNITTPLTGLQIGYKYTIVLWYAKHNFTASATATINIENGSWLSETWTATNTGSNVWLEKCFTFTANASSTTLEFVGTSPTPCCGVLIDDLTMFECAPDNEAPEFTTLPDPLINVKCEKDVPIAEVLTATDLCDQNLSVIFSEIKQGPPCNQTITRIWFVEDKCMNSTSVEQIITAEDDEAPIITEPPVEKIVSCDENVLGEFYQWINAQGGAKATDNCSNVKWTANFNQEPSLPCEVTNVEFVAEDDCGNQIAVNSAFTVVDLVAPVFTKLPTSPILQCFTNPYDSLLAWIAVNGNALGTDNCGTVQWSNDFDGNLTQTDYTINFTIRDYCNNEKTVEAVFKIQKSSITSNFTKSSCDISLVGIDTVIFSVGNCDSLVITNTLFSKSDTSLILGFSCNNASAYNDTLLLKNINGCDSLVIRKIDYQKPDSTMLLNFICGLQNEYSDTTLFSGQFCDSLVITQYKSYPINLISINKTSCDSSKVGTATINLINQYGCDSTLTIITSLTSIIYTFISVDFCGQGLNYADTVSYQTLECDSVVVSNYIFHPLDTSYSTSFTCDKNQTGIIETSFLNQWGCDSLHYETISLNPSDTVQLTEFTCDISNQGVFQISLSNQYNCDSTVVTTIIYVPSDTSYIIEGTCDLSKVGISSVTIPSFPCDSVVILERFFVPGYQTVNSGITCNIDLVGTDTLSLKSVEGCDSIIINQLGYLGIESQNIVTQETCKGLNDGSISIEDIVNATPPIEYSLDGINWSQSPIFMQLQPGTFNIYIRDLKGCKSITNNVLLLEGENFTIDLGPNIIAKEGEEIAIILNSSSFPAEVNWLPASLISCNNCLSAIVQPETNTWIYASAISLAGCPAFDSVFVKILPQLNVYIPNAFSPDLNGINDRWIIYGNKNVINIAELSIYDRWGSNVFVGQNIIPGDTSKGWDGKFHGKLMDPAVFVFWAKIEFSNGKVEIVKGEINLLR